MIATAVIIYVKPEHVEEFIKATRENHKQSVAEPENLRFDFLRSADDPNRFMLYEVYTGPEGATAHKETAHYKKWKETVAPWMEKPREGLKHEVILPESPEQWRTRS